MAHCLDKIRGKKLDDYAREVGTHRAYPPQKGARGKQADDELRATVRAIEELGEQSEGRN